MLWSALMGHRDVQERGYQMNYVTGYVMCLEDVLKKLEDGQLYQDDTFWDFHSWLREQVKQSHVALDRIREASNGQ